MTSLALCGSQVCPAAKKENAEANKKNPEANKLALEGAEAAKNQDWNKAVDLLKKAAAMDHKYTDELSAVYQRRGYAAANEQRYGDAINDYDEALKLTPQEAPRIHEQRAAVEMKIQDYDKALADYSELIKLKPNEIKYITYRAYIYELKNDLQNSMADNEKILKADPNNQDAKARKQRLEQKIAERTPLTPPPRTPTPSPAAKKSPKKKRSRHLAPLRRLRPGKLWLGQCSSFFAFLICFRRCEFSFPAVRRQRRQGHGDIATGDLRVGFHLRHAGKIVANFFYQMSPKLLVRHFAAAELQLNTHLVAAVQEFFGVPDFRHVIVLVDVNAELDFLQFRAGWLLIFRVFGNVVSELSEIDNLAHRRIRRGRDFDQILAESLSFTQGVG